ncbi:MAG: tetratricopeptide repeat protein [Bacteroidales bacterium]|jgi:TolA-binding protein|nr:tetratricopeptide repeat protein [Bacteroidales bacterium]
MKRGLFILTLTAMLFTMCNTSQMSKDQELKKIVEMENLYRNSQPTKLHENAQNLLNIYSDFIGKYPQDTLVPEFLMRSSIVALNTQQESYAITLLNRIYENYPSNSLRAEALFRQAYIYDAFLSDQDKAKALYEQFLLMFPDDSLAKDAEQLLLFLDKDPEEFIKYLIEQQEAIDPDFERAI